MTPALHLRLLGHPELRLESRLLPCSDTSLRILAILALDGPQERLKLADLLWDGSTERVLHNLRMALLKLRRSLGAHSGVLRDQNQFLQLDLGRVQVDALNPPQEAERLLTYWREFMPGQRCKGSENWLEWAGQTEERLLEAHIQQLQGVAAGLPSPQRQGFENRIKHLQAVLRGEESPVYQPVVPLSAAPAQEPQKSQPTAPPLIGREDVLEQILQATERRQIVMLTGEAGSGKSAMQEAIRGLFEQSVIVPSEFKPTDAHYPLSTMYRALRFAQQILGSRQQIPDVPDHLVYATVLHLSSEGLSHFQQLSQNFYSAIFENPLISWGDDVHLWDDHSNLLAANLVAEALRQSKAANVIVTCRSNATSSALHKLNWKLAESGRMVMIPLKPLTLLQTAALSDQQNCSLNDAEVYGLHQFTGGNPGLLTSLLEQTGCSGVFPEKLSLPQQTATSFQARLHLLQPAERQVLRLAALCEEPFNFSVSLACEVLGQSEPQVLDAVENLYHHGYFLGCSVHPPAVREVVIGSMPEPTRLHLIHKLRQSYGAQPATQMFSSLKN